MFRAAVSRLRALKGHGSSDRIPVRFVSSSAVSSSRSSGGLLSWLIGDKHNALPLDYALTGVEHPPALPDRVEPGKTVVTTLENGIKIASETSPTPSTSIGLYVDCGSIYESPESSGASHLLERMAFKTTRNRSHLRIVREAEAIGGHMQAAASREQMGYTFDALKTYLPEMVELLIDCVRNPAFLDWELSEELQKLKSEVVEASNNPHALILEAIHSAGFSGPLANPLLAPVSAINRLNSTLLEQFVAENYTAGRMVLAASGVDHEELVSVAKPLLSDLPSFKGPSIPESVYTGGDFRCQADSGQITHFAIAFGLPGGWTNLKDAMTLTVLQALMGGGGSFSTGGPGKGMHSRLYLRVLSQHPQIQSFSAFDNIYDKYSIFGIQGSTGSDFASKAIDVAVNELIAIGTPGGVDDVQLTRAKHLSKSTLLMTLESRMVICEDIGRQILSFNERKPVEHFLKLTDQVTLQDITKIVQRLISSPLTMASYGDVINVPTYDSVKSKFSSN